MSYQGIVDLIRNISNTINPTGTFMHGRRSDGSLEYDGAFPQIHLYPVRLSFDIANDVERNEIIIMFWQQDSPESSNDEREAIISQMDILSTNFLNAIYNEVNISITNILKTPEYRQLAGTVSGYGVSFTIVGKVDCLSE